MSRIAPPIANRLDLPLNDGKLLQVNFDRSHDRWRHRVSLVLPEGSSAVSPLLLFESIEGTSHEDWPVSPPLQFVSIETRPKKPPVALLMGMAGGSHWSASIEQQPAEQALRFDVACRVKGEPMNLGSRYRLAPRVESVEALGDRIVLRAAGATFELVGESVKDSPVPTLELSDRELHIHFGQPVADQSATHRWMYRLQAV
ncbi:hypothetical protein ETAA8_50390 [Anatilimnocola aggregata]|uniref:Uncharacterized protein n=1 Tax=Anatilimnocola aggregata TaxID=2528021 RepID=A0A517YI83_9BACT|nr:hypothetical protein [Anatilimnocola aggregata]QDU29922.1 hypothetical protein ETAA8_50390 [Anatilimnocola aggregata]